MNLTSGGWRWEEGGGLWRRDRVNIQESKGGKRAEVSPDCPVMKLVYCLRSYQEKSLLTYTLIPTFYKVISTAWCHKVAVRSGSPLSERLKRECADLKHLLADFTSCFKGALDNAQNINGESRDYTQCSIPDLQEILLDICYTACLIFHFFGLTD